jgi:ABC-type multidrug transport system fused ATPase/permease subunit
VDGFLTQLLTMLGYQLPELLACTAGVAMLAIWVPAAPGRKLALAGMVVMLLTTLLRGAMSVWQAWLINNATDGYSALSGMMTVFGAVGMLLSVVSATGLVMLVWGACKAMQAVPRG